MPSPKAKRSVREGAKSEGIDSVSVCSPVAALTGIDSLLEPGPTRFGGLRVRWVSQHMLKDGP